MSEVKRFVVDMQGRGEECVLATDYDRELHNAIAAGIRMQDKCAALEAENENLRLSWGLLRSENNALRQQLAGEKALTDTLREEISEHSNDLTVTYLAGGYDMRQQRDKLAGLLKEIAVGVSRRELLAADVCAMIDAALAEIKP